ncbi:MAG: 5'/3'-nucleotidase SurE [Thermoflavifilum sp.]|nr:5'/3'-nucleotidase SurE [Thermoflavifilum sp.]
MSEKIILITNDDGITAPGLRYLVEAVKSLGKVVVVAPDSPQSGMGHAITIGVPLRLYPVEIFEGIDAYQSSGTPVDCVKLAKDKILHRAPDICLSGINHGANHSINIIYSGTMSAAMEAAIEGIPSIGFSLLDYRFEADFSAAQQIAYRLTQQMLNTDNLPKGSLLNVNIPALPMEQIKGIKICRQAHAKWVEEFDERRDPRGEKYYWLTGRFQSLDNGQDTDVWALENGYVSVVPTHFDLTNYQLKAFLENHWNIFT